MLEIKRKEDKSIVPADNTPYSSKLIIIPKSSISSLYVFVKKKGE